MRKQRRHELAENRSIDMTPMIDVVFQLILFFMLTSSLVKPNQIELDLPESSSGVKASDKTNLIVAYRSAEGRAEIKLNGQEIQTLGSLGDAMRTAADPSTGPHVDLRIDRSVPYQEVISLVDAVRDAGFPKFSLLTLAPDAPRKN